MSLNRQHSYWIQSPWSAQGLPRIDEESNLAKYQKWILRSTYNKVILRESTQICLPTKARTFEHSLYRMPQFQETKFPWTFCLGTAPRFLGPVVLVTTGVDVAEWEWVPYSYIVNTWPPVGGTIWEWVGGVALLEEVCPWEVGFDLSRAHVFLS